eukprot:TRINITY_DN197_c0_g1_i7.p1 TRINITY_DN197_c0_g1~~TRINITY_DN197_c0_g1_i7.p1  ORF type:complete len:105 (-),score=5.89 TRINITY_DN197_c0_g1_i7:104-418(-)
MIDRPTQQEGRVALRLRNITGIWRKHYANFLSLSLSFFLDYSAFSLPLSLSPYLLPFMQVTIHRITEPVRRLNDRDDAVCHSSSSVTNVTDHVYQRQHAIAERR